jgi:hypothetical protein
VRDAAAKTLNALVAQAPAQAAKEVFTPLLVRLCAEANWFTR